MNQTEPVNAIVEKIRVVDQVETLLSQLKNWEARRADLEKHQKHFNVNVSF